MRWSFDGVNDWVTVPDAAALDLTTGMTLSAWLLRRSSGWRDGAAQGAHRRTGLRALHARRQRSPRPPRLHVRIGSSDSGSARRGAARAQHVDASRHDVRRRGAVGSRQRRAGREPRTIAGSVTATTGALRIGGNSIWGEGLSGLIDDLRIHRRALTAGELQSLMNVSVGEAAGFHIIAYNDSVTIGRSDSATYFLELSPVGGFTLARSPPR